MAKSKMNTGDEVCMLVKDDLVFGTLEYKINKSNVAVVANGGGGGDTSASLSNLWRVKWIHDPSRVVPFDVEERHLIPTDRVIYKGSKVEMKKDDGSVVRGVVHSVLYFVDLRILGTNTVVPSVPIDDFSHLKEYTQKSVVTYRGWLGIVLTVERMVQLRHSDDTESTVDLNSVIPTGGPLRIESHWINEEVDIMKYPTFTCLTKKAEKKAITHAVWKKARSSAFIKDIVVKNIKVQWIHQIDPEYPDKPKQEFKGTSYKELKLIKENTVVNDSAFSFEVGNIGRYEVTGQREFQRWDDWQRKFAQRNSLPESVSTKLQTSFQYQQNLKDNYWRVYDNVQPLDEQGKEHDKFKIGSTVVVEIAHITTIAADIAWEDGSFEIPRSSLCLDVIEDSLLSNHDLPRPGDFITTKLAELVVYPPEKAYFVVVKRATLGEGKSQLTMKVLDVEVAGKIIQDNIIITGDLRLSSKQVERHPIFQYFNESSTIVVMNEDSHQGKKIRIGSVIGTNLQGKINCRFLEVSNGKTHYKDEWIWPQVCAIYSAKGYDLECIKSHIIDVEESDNETKIFKVIEMLENKVELVWKNSSKSDQDLTTSLSEFNFIFESFKNLVRKLNTHVDLKFLHYDSLTAYLALPIGTTTDSRPSYYKGNTKLCELVLNSVNELLQRARELLVIFGNVGDEPPMDVHMVDVSNQQTNDIVTDPLAELFGETAKLLESYPPGHHYATTTKYNPEHNRSFLKTVKEELERLKKICYTENQTEMGILSRVYENRMDLVSFMIRGPTDTPYENSLYIFDAYLPPTYPAVPPQFHFHAFKAGRLNPNLYAEGKVCVSLLGTWRGNNDTEQWCKESNIVQVLLSIQALILVREPYHLEPGLEAEKYTPSEARKVCQAYNIQLAPLIVQMMINQIEFGMEPWTELINKFYAIQVPIFVSRWRLWLDAKDEKGLGDLKPKFALFPLDKKFIDKMKGLLKRLESLHKSKLLV